MPGVTEISLTSIPLERAQRALDAGRAKGIELGTAFTIVVLDSGAHLVAVS
ncbi:hypothetical protein ACTMS0_20875 [Micromonospora sp. H33]|uniref:hypothetical protein n=1 Tax=Micromonospora sp. H33 TaxID=3452215 RepID=UPI003F8B2779